MDSSSTENYLSRLDDILEHVQRVGELMNVSEYFLQVYKDTTFRSTLSSAFTVQQKSSDRVI